MSIYKDLAAATSLSYDKQGDPQEYLNSVVEAVNGLDEDSWKGLSEEAKAWFNDAAKAISEAPEGEAVTLTIPEGMPKAKAAKAAKEKAPKAAKEPKERKAPKERGNSAARHVREILCEDYSLSLADVMVKLGERGVAMQKSSAQVVYLNTVRAFEVASEIGAVKKSGNTVLTAA